MLSNNKKEKEKEEIKPWGFQLSENEKLGGFGFYKIQLKTDRDYPVDNFMNDLVIDIDKRFSHDLYNFFHLKYKLAALLSVMENPYCKLEQGKSMPDEVELVFIHLKRLLNRAKNDVNSSAGTYLDHVFWYYKEPQDKTKTSLMNRYLVIEGHPYMDIKNDDITFFAQIIEIDKPFLNIEIDRGSHYFMNHTICIRFIFDTHNKTLQDEIDKNQYKGALTRETGLEEEEEEEEDPE